MCLATSNYHTPKSQRLRTTRFIRRERRPRSVSPHALSILNINKNYLVINYFRQFEIIGLKLTKIGLPGVCLFLYLLRRRMNFH